MKEFEKIRLRKILVGVDLSHGDSLVSEELAASTSEAIARATHLALLNRAELHCMCALDVGPRTQQLIAMTRGLANNVLDKAQAALDALATRARSQGVPTRTSVVFGRSWMELIHQVLRDKSDLLVVGTRHLGRLHGALVGSTGMRLVRKCPCPVWINQPLKDAKLDHILVATDFSPACDLALDLAASIASSTHAQLELLHVLDLLSETEFQELLHYRDEYRMHSDGFERHAEEEMNRRLARLETAGLDKAPEAFLLHGRPGGTIKTQVEKLRADLLVMGTMARTGIPGLIIGNTAEHLLSQVDCSILAVKPPGYVSPVHLPDDES